MIWVGVDPGAKGGYAVIEDVGKDKVAYAYPWDDTFFVFEMCNLMQRKAEGITAVVEKVGAMPHQGVKSMFNFGKTAGFIEGVLSALGIPYQLIPPATWKKEFSLIGKDKKASIEVCHRLYPNVGLFPTERSRVCSDGMADALCMAEYGRRHL